MKSSDLLREVKAMAMSQIVLGDLARKSQKLKEALRRLHEAEDALRGFLEMAWQPLPSPHASEERLETLESKEKELRRAHQRCGQAVVEALRNADPNIGEEDALGMLNNRYTIEL